MYFAYLESSSSKKQLFGVLLLVSSVTVVLISEMTWNLTMKFEQWGKDFGAFYQFRPLIFDFD